MNQNEKPILVAIHCLVYNHEPYLRDCFEGFVMQKTNFRFVAIVHDDCSKDKSADIIREYAKKFPDIFHPIYETENQYSKNDGSIKRIMYKAIDESGAKYVAMCEGDDYWTDPYKLQKQIDILEVDESLVACFTDCMMVDKEGNVLQEKRPTVKRENAGRYNLREFLEDNRTSTLSLVYRNIHREELRRNHERLKNKYLGDWQLYICLLIYGDMYYLNQVTCAYRVNPASLTNALWPKERVGRIKEDRKVYKGVAEILPPEYADIAADFRDIRWTWVPLMFAYKAEKRYWGMIGCFIVSCFVCPGRLWRAFKEGLQKRL